MQAIYEPRGRAREYAELAFSAYSGCSHGCGYCFNPEALHKDPADYLNSLPREGILEKLERDLAQMQERHDLREVLMSFSTDPYQPIEEELRLTRKSINLFMIYGRRFTILTKGGLRSTRDFDLMRIYRGNCRYGTTLVFTDWCQEKIWEPCAAHTEERIQALVHAHQLGIPTWVSLEPVFDPYQSLALLEATLGFVDEYRLGMLNHMESPGRIDYREYLGIAVRLLEEHKKKYLIKRDLRLAAGVE